MKTISIKLAPRLHAKLQRAAQKSCLSKSDVVRLALEQFLKSAPSGKRPVSALKLAGDLVGCLEGPADLSTNPKYWEGFGE